MEQTTFDVWENFSGRLRSFIFERISDPTDADDVLQEIFIKVHTHLSTLRDEDRLASWLYQITRNAIIDYYRTRRQSAAIPETFVLEIEHDYADSISQLAIGVRYVIEILPDKYRQALLLTEIEGLSQKEMTERLGISLSAAKSRVKRGRQMVRSALLNCCHFELDRQGNLVDYTPPEDCHYCNSG